MTEEKLKEDINIAVRQYGVGVITTERLSEVLGVNFYELIEVFRSWNRRQEQALGRPNSQSSNREGMMLDQWIELGRAIEQLKATIFTELIEPLIKVCRTPFASR